MDFPKYIKQKLAKYKSKRFPHLEDGISVRYKKPYPHILPQAVAHMNLLSTFRKDLVAYISSNEIKPHRDFHHLNSSQAMCFNFFYPLLADKKLELILNYLGFKDETVNYSTPEFEKDGLEKTYGESPTQFDFYFETNSGKKLHFEIKYTEGDFGKQSLDKTHIDKYEKVYSKHLSAIRTNYHSVEMFLENYQVIRNIIHIEEDSYVVFIYPEDNRKVKKAAHNVEAKMLKSEYAENFYSVSWEDIFESVSSNSSISAEIQEQFYEFKSKYLYSKS